MENTEDLWETNVPGIIHVTYRQFYATTQNSIQYLLVSHIHLELNERRGGQANSVVASGRESDGFESFHLRSTSPTDILRWPRPLPEHDNFGNKGRQDSCIAAKTTPNLSFDDGASVAKRFLGLS